MANENKYLNYAGVETLWSKIKALVDTKLDKTSFHDNDRYVNSAAFADDSTNTAASPVKMTLTRAGSDTATVTANIPKVSSSSAGVVPKGNTVTTQSTTTKFLREDGTWAIPSYIADTHYTTHLKAGASATATAHATTTEANNKVYVNAIDNTTVRDTITLSGAGATKVYTDDSGNITIKSTDTNTDTKVTSVGNHYTPSTANNSTISAASGTLTDITNSSTGVNVITGITKDAAGHITGVDSVALKSVNTNTTYSAGTDLSLSGTTFNHSASGVTAQATAGLYKVAYNAQGHITSTTAVAKSDITALGIPSTNTTYSNATTSAAGLMSAADKTKLDGITAAMNFKGVVTELPAATATGYNNGDVIVVGNKEYVLNKPASGTASWVELGDASDYALKTSLATVATSGSYTDLTNKPSIPTESTVSGWGFTKDVNTDTKVTSVGNHYTPSGGTTTSASGGTLTDITNSAAGVQVLTGIKKDAAGHITDVTSIALKSTNTNTTYNDMTGASSSAAGAHGLVPAPAAGKQASFLRGDGTWAVPTDTNTTYSAGSGLSLSGTTFNHSNSVTAVDTAGLYKVKYDAQGHITGTTAITKTDITGLGIPSSDTNTVTTVSNVTSGTNIGAVQVSVNGGTATNVVIPITTSELNALLV